MPRKSTKIRRAGFLLSLRFRSNLRLGFLCKHLFRSRQTVVGGVSSLVPRLDFRGQCEKAIQTHSTFASLFLGRLGPHFLQRKQSSLSFSIPLLNRKLKRRILSKSYSLSPLHSRQPFCSNIPEAKQHFFVRSSHFVLFADSALMYGRKKNHCFTGKYTTFYS
jgi:hypothetical protein